MDRTGVRMLHDSFTNKPYVHFYTTKRVGGGLLNPEILRVLMMAAALSKQPGSDRRAPTLVRMEAIMPVKKNDPALKAGATAIEDNVHGAADPAPAAALEEASGAIIEPAITDAVDVSHESVDAKPREGTTPAQNAIDWNDPKRGRPDEPDFTGQGVDRAVYRRAVD